MSDRSNRDHQRRPLEGFGKYEITFDDFWGVLDALHVVYPVTAAALPQWGFNMDSSTAWIVAEPGLDIAVLILEVTGLPPIAQSTIRRAS